MEHLAIQLLWVTALPLFTRVSPIYLANEFAVLFLVLLNEMRMLGKSNALPFLFLVLIKGVSGVCLEAATGGVLQKCCS